MSNTLVTSTVNPSPFPTTFTVNTAHAANETSSQAINIGNLQEESALISLSDQGKQASQALSTTFTTQPGDAVILSQDFQNFVNQVTTRLQILDGQGNVLADNQGTDAQKAKYQQWLAGNLSLPAGTYTATATPVAGTQLTLGTTQQQGTSLQVNSQLTGGDPAEYYNFSLSAGNNIKLAFDAGSQNPSTRVQLYNSAGNLVADSAGNPFQRANYIALTSGTGLTASTGNYQVKVSYANGANTDNNIKYSLQLYSGTNYAVVYKTNATAQPDDKTAAGSVTADPQALAFSRQDFNKIGATAFTAVNIGWLAQDKSTLQVLSQLTGADKSEIYSFTLQTGDNLKFGFNASQTQNPDNLRVQLLDSSGLFVIADSGGTPAQQAAYKSLTTTDGLASKPGNYTVRVTYANGAPQFPEQYEFNVYSGTTYTAQYKTIASPQTYGNALLSGGISGTSAGSAMANYLQSLANGDSPDIMSALKATIA